LLFFFGRYALAVAIKHWQAGKRECRQLDEQQKSVMLVLLCAG
jgi:hypothetical protein